MIALCLCCEMGDFSRLTLALWAGLGREGREAGEVDDGAGDRRRAGGRKEGRPPLCFKCRTYLSRRRREEGGRRRKEKRERRRDSYLRN